LKETVLEDDLEIITKIMRNLFDEYEGPVTPSLSARDVAQWNSLMNVQFLVLVEQAFGIRFELLEALKTKRAEANGHPSR
jgi:acyl carrier protein